MKTRPLRRDIAKSRSNCRLHRANFAPKGSVADYIPQHSDASVLNAVRTAQTRPPRAPVQPAFPQSHAQPSAGSLHAIALTSNRPDVSLQSSTFFRDLPDAACIALQISTSRVSRASGATGGCFDPPVNLKNTGERSPSRVATGEFLMSG